MKTLNAVVGLVLILYGNTVILLSRSSGFDTPGGMAFGSFIVVEGLLCIIAGVIVAAMGLTEATTP